MISFFMFYFLLLQNWTMFKVSLCSVTKNVADANMLSEKAIRILFACTRGTFCWMEGTTYTSCTKLLADFYASSRELSIFISPH